MDSDSAVSSSQRKIELQSPEDLTYLITNVRNAAAHRLNEAFPQVPDAQGEDELRNQIEALVNEYIDNTFTLASGNLSINGLPITTDNFLSMSKSSSSSEPSYEPYDARKRQRVADLIAQEEKLLEEVAALKRSVPAKVAAEHAERMKEAIKADQEAVEETVRRLQSDVGGRAEEERLDVGPLERQEGVEGGFGRAVDGLGRLKRDMPSVVAKMQRAKDAGEYVMMAGN